MRDERDILDFAPDAALEYAAVTYQVRKIKIKAPDGTTIYEVACMTDGMNPPNFSISDESNNDSISLRWYEAPLVAKALLRLYGWTTPPIPPS